MGGLAGAVTASIAAGAAQRLPAGPSWRVTCISACKGDALNLDDYCYGLQNGQAIGLIDAALASDELDQATGIYYDGENTLPAPEGPGNPVVEVWNNTGDYTLIAADTENSQDALADANRSR
ncbi:hypothetical protein KGQ20_11140 [Catenulispora sp. NF23]|uniref:Uncharacterized protein n=1 Tax=Catenulispora pinistramenti TaxID=2705254 RepID=A0ABS5KJ21_9ACTN|nr:hypothetical protein [Catenulispora pinistramenti]MBS2533329.1 hypothetical protein [Catenulispora pinistramenti]MBS2546399.1 hypothetical protein [Catenulispora pinistramenti]